MVTNMKKILYHVAFAFLAVFLLGACSAEEFSGANGELPNIADYADNFNISVDQDINTANFSFNSAEGVTPVWVIDGAYSSDYTLSKYYRKKGTYDVECFVKNRNGISKESVKKQFNIEKTKMNGFAGFVEDSEFNLFKNVTLPNNPGNNDDETHNPAFWYAPGWSQIAAPECSLTKGCYTVKLPVATGERWQAQMALNHLGISTSADKKYDFSCILTSSKGHNGVKVKICDTGDDNVILFDKDIKLEAGEPKCIFGSDLDGVNISDMKIVLDFGGNQAGDEIMVESFVLKDHANDDGTEVPEELNVPFEYTTAGNLWKAVDEAKSFTEETWYGDANWGAIDVTPVIKHEGSKHIIIVPTDTPTEKWHAQWKMLGVPISAKADAKVDFSCRVTTTAKLPMMTMKLCDDANDGNLFFEETVNNIKDEYVYRIEDQPIQGDAAGAMDKMKLVIDLAGAPKDAEVTISDIVVILK